MKIFIGFENVSSTVTDITRCFQESGHEVFTAISNLPSKVELNTADFVLQKEFEKVPLIRPEFVGIRLRSWWETRVRKAFLKKCLRECDAFIFIWSTFYHDYSDLEIIRKHNKKIVFVFAGDDVRWRKAASEEFKSFGLGEIPFDSEGNEVFNTQKHLVKNLKRLRYAEKYADIIFSRLDQGQLQLRPYYRWNMMVNPDNYNHAPAQRKLDPKIIHAPTSRAIKGTAFIEKAFRRLKEEGILFTPVFVENVDHRQALKIYEDADIIIDQLILPGTGKFASEGLAMGKVVIAQMGYGKYPQKNPENCPIVDANCDTIYEVLKGIILDYDLRCKLAEQGRAYADRYLHPKYFCETVLTNLEKDNTNKGEYYPTFFRDEFKPEPENIEVYNQWTAFVKEELWYKQQIKPGERDGLIF